MTLSSATLFLSIKYNSGEISYKVREDIRQPSTYFLLVYQFPSTVTVYIEMYTEKAHPLLE